MSGTVETSKWKTNGLATLYGLFLDWGGEDFGARIGYSSVTTAGYRKFTNGGDLNGSDAVWYLNLRWAAKEGPTIRAQ